MDKRLGRSVLPKARNYFGASRSRDLSFVVAHTGEGRTDCKPRANKRLFRGEKGGSRNRFDAGEPLVQLKKVQGGRSGTLPVSG